MGRKTQSDDSWFCCADRERIHTVEGGVLVIWLGGDTGRSIDEGELGVTITASEYQSSPWPLCRGAFALKKSLCPENEETKGIH